MLIQQKETGKKGKFFIEADGKELGEMLYTLKEPGLMIIDHTEVNDELQGKNVDYHLVSKGAEYARKKNLKIIPLCTFAASLFKKKPAEFADVLNA